MTNPNVEPGQRRELWLALLRRLTHVSSSFLVWKNVESALEGQGDIDAAAAPADWDVLEEQFLEWARELDLLPAALCHHIPGGRNLIAAPVGTPTFFELSIKHDKAFRGSTLFVLDDLLAMSEMDDRGFRKLRAGRRRLVEARSQRVEVARTTRMSRGLAGKHVRELVASDPEGVAMASKVFGRAEAPRRGASQPRSPRVDGTAARCARSRRTQSSRDSGTRRSWPGARGSGSRRSGNARSCTRSVTGG